MRRLLIAIALCLPVLCAGQKIDFEQNDKCFIVTTVWQDNMGPFRAPGGPCSVFYFNDKGKTLYILRVGSSSNHDDATAVLMGESLEEALEWLDGMVILSGFNVGSIFNIKSDITWIKEPDGILKQAMHHPAMVGDRHFTGLGEANEKGSSIVLIPDKSRRIFGTHGVHDRTFKELRKKLKRQAEKLGLK